MFHWRARSLVIFCAVLFGLLASPANAQCIGGGPVTGAARQTLEGLPGGPFPGAIVKPYHLSTNQATPYTITPSVNWITVTPTSGNITNPSGATVNPAYTVELNSNVNGLPVGRHLATVALTASACPSPNTATLTVFEVFVRIPGTISLSPATAFNSTGKQGGPFPTATYSVTNAGQGDAQNMIYTATSSQPWVRFSAFGAGPVSPGSSQQGIIEFTTAANLLAPGTYGANIEFRNTVNTGLGDTTIPVSLTVLPSSTNPEIVSAVLPGARSVAINQPATAFATVINASSQTLSGCQIRMPGNTQASIPADFQFRASDANNNFIAPPNQPMTVPAGGRQDFVFGITPRGAMNSNDLGMVFICDGTLPAQSIPGLNTFILSAASSPSPDMVAIGVTLSNDGIVSLPGPSGLNLFVASVINIGAPDSITATVDDGGRGLPLAVTLCQTNPSTGACINPTTPGGQVVFSSATNGIATFTITVQGNGNIPFDPANNRLFMRFKTADGVTRGATNVAVRTLPSDAGRTASKTD